MSVAPIRICGVLVTYRRREALRATLSRLSSQTRPLDRLVIVDNGSDPMVEAMSAEVGIDDVLYLDPGDNVGPAGGYARGLEYLLAGASGDEWVVLLDDDDPPFFDDAFENIESFIDRCLADDPSTGGVGISGGRFDLTKGVVRRIGDHEISGAVPVDHVTGGGLPTYRVSAIRQVGLPLEQLFFGFEELEYGLRMTTAGFHVYADGDQWKHRKEVKRAKGLLPPEEVSAERSRKVSVRVAEPSWRRYYSLRNLVHILRRYGHSGTALKVVLTRGIAKPILNLFLAPGPAWRNLSLNLKAASDGWRGRMGRTLDPF